MAAETSQVHLGEPIDRHVDGELSANDRPINLSQTSNFTVGLAYHKKQAIKAYEIIGSALDPSAQVTNKILTVKSLLPPLTREEIGVVRCLGLNYADHAVCQPFVRPVI